MKRLFYTTAFLKLISYSFLIAIILHTSCKSSDYHVVKVGEREKAPKEEGIYYMLPQTKITIDVIVHKTDQLRGPYSAYAKKFLGLTTVIKGSSSSYQIADIKIDAQNIADPSESYCIVLPKNVKKKEQFSLQFSNDFILYSINKDVNYAVNMEETDVLNYDNIDEINNTFKYFANDNVFVKVDTIIEMVNMDTMMVEKRTYKQTEMMKTLEQRAKDAADYIMRLREGKYQLITGYQEVNYSKETMAFMYNELDQLEKEYLTLFTGKEVRKELHYKYEIIPQQKDSSLIFPLFRFSDNMGLRALQSGIGDIIYLELQNEEIFKAIQADIDIKKQPKKKGFYYRMPAKCKVFIKKEGSDLAEREVYISQYGVICNLPRSNASILFYKENGSIEKIELKR
jgi:hypothetical protein